MVYLEKVLDVLEYYAGQVNRGKRPLLTDSHIVYVFLVWFSIICKNPFNLAKFDNAEAGASTKSIMHRIIDCLATFQRCYHIQGEMVG